MQHEHAKELAKHCEAREKQVSEMKGLKDQYTLQIQTMQYEIDEKNNLVEILNGSVEDLAS